MLKIRKCGHKDLEKYYSLISVDFNSEEIISRLYIHMAMHTGALEMLVFYDEETGIDIGYAIVFTKSLYGYVLIKYLAIFPWHRNKGYGDMAINLISERYKDKQGIIAEIADFKNNDPDHHIKLRRFFAYYGFISAKADYRIRGVKTSLMVKSEKGTADISPVVHRIIRDIYSGILPKSVMSKIIEIRN